MIRNVVIHVSNEQPLLADLFGIPTASDAGLLCTNLRMMDGKRPVFIDTITATFFFPYLVIRFLEIPPGAIDRHWAELGVDPASAAAQPGAAAGAGAAQPTGTRLPVLSTEPPPAEPPEGEIELDLDIDEGFLQRVRDI